MGKLLRVIIVLALCASFTFAGGANGLAEPSIEEVKQLLQKGLNLAELDQEIARLSTREEELGVRITDTGKLIASNQQQVEKTREHAGKVLRAYYMGERTSVWMLLLSAKSLSDALSVYQYLNMIVENDHLALDTYSDSYKSLTAAKDKLEAERKELQDVKASFIEQRDKAAAVQKDINETIAASADAEALRSELDRFTVEWKEQGVPLFRKYLSSISQAMQGLPELLTGDNGSKYLKASFTKATFAIPDSDLTDFFRTKNSLFNNITFKFAEDSFQAFGREGDTDLSIKGHYTIENTDVNKLQFHVDQLTYKGFLLPETSNRALEQEFDLGFTPSNYLKGFNLTVTKISFENGLMSLELKL